MSYSGVFYVPLCVLSANAIEPASRSDFETMAVSGIVAWIKSQGFSCLYLAKDLVIDRAESIRWWLLDDKIHKRPEMHMEVAVPMVRDRYDLDRLTTVQLQS